MTGRALASSVVLPAGLMIAAAGIILPTPTTIQARVLQHLLSLTVQVLAAGLAVLLVRQTAPKSEHEHRERQTWQQLSLAMLLWTAGLLLYAAAEWFGQRPSFPSASDGFFVASFLVMGLALGNEIWLLSPLTHRQRLMLGGAAVVVWAALIVQFNWPILASPLDPLERILHIFYSTAPALLLSLGLARVVAYRSTGMAYAWTAITAGAGSLSLASFGAAYLSWFDLYTDVHPINLLRVAGCALLIAGATWHRRMSGAIGIAAAITPAGRPGVSREYVGVRGRNVPMLLADVPLLVSLGLGVAVGGLVALLVAGGWNRAQTVPSRTPSSLREARHTASVPATPAPVPTAGPAASPPSPEPPRPAIGTLDTSGERYRSASRMLAEGRLREAQDGFLEILLQTPSDLKAMQGLVAVRRRLAGHDPVKLRRQAAAYESAIASRVETEEHYTIEAMAVLLRASVLAANEIDAERRRKR